MAKQHFIHSIGNAMKGIVQGISSHRNIQIMLVISIVVLCLGKYYELVRFEWAIIWVCIGMVLGLELINTSIEILLDHLHPEMNENIGRAKDVSAGAVLIACIASGIAGLYIFIPHILY